MARSATIDSIIATTLPKIRGEVANLVYRNSAVANALLSKGKIKESTQGGEEIYETVWVTAPVGVDSFSGTDTLTTTVTDSMTSATYGWKFIAGTAGITLEDETKNAGEEAKINLAKERIKQLRAALTNKLDTDLTGDGQGNSGKDFAGLRLYVSDAAPVVNVGGISESTYPNWTNIRPTAVAAFGTSRTATTGGYYAIKDTFFKCSDGQSRPDVAISSLSAFISLENTLEGNTTSYQRKDDNWAGWTTVELFGTPVVVSRAANIGGYSADSLTPPARFYWLNTDTMKLVIAKNASFLLEGPVQPYNQKVKWWSLTLGGNLTIKDRRKNGVVQITAAA